MPKIEHDDIVMDDADRHLLGPYRWYRRDDGYIVRNQYIGWIDGRYRYARLYLHRLIANAGPGEVVDHINGDRSDNRRRNLRLVTQSLNMRNASVAPHARNKSGYRGVFWDNTKQKWQARAKLDGHSYSIGYFETAADAGIAAHVWRLQHMPGYKENIDPAALAEARARMREPRKRRIKNAVVYCACGCGRPVRTSTRCRFAHGGRPKLGHGTLPAGVQIDDEDRYILTGRSWHITNNNYVASRRNGKIELLHRLILDPPDSMVVDHINGDKLDNRRANLRIVTFAENVQNQSRLLSNNTSGYRGVVWDRSRSKWIAQVKMGGKNYLLGRFETKEEANRVVIEWRRKNMPGATD
jgi:HNH endonuclease/AP2 domain